MYYLMSAKRPLDGNGKRVIKSGEDGRGQNLNQDLR
jgi:hypothetical protein